MLEIINILKVIIVGIIEGVAEWLPISSTSHMMVFDKFFKLPFSDQFMAVFLVVIQFGAILAICVLYFDRLNPFAPTKTERQKKSTWLLWRNIIVAAIPAGITGVLFNKLIDKYLEKPLIIASMLIIYGCIFIVLERWRKVHQTKDRIQSFDDLNTIDSLKIGLFQMLALIPGTSRSGATITGALVSGVSRRIAAEFAFFVGIPVMVGASMLKIIKFGFKFSVMELFYLGLGVLVTFIVSLIVVKTLIKYLQNNDFQIFGWYRILLGMAIIIFFIVK